MLEGYQRCTQLFPEIVVRVLSSLQSGVRKRSLSTNVKEYRAIFNGAKLRVDNVLLLERPRVSVVEVVEDLVECKDLGRRVFS